jgi:hypothetical protein
MGRRASAISAAIRVFCVPAFFVFDFQEGLDNGVAPPAYFFVPFMPFMPFVVNSQFAFVAIEPSPLNQKGPAMREKGFGSHGAMGAALLGMVWLAIYLPRMLPLLRLGGWPAGLVVVAGLLGILGGPLLLVLVEGDEGFGILGIVVALFVGWASTKVAMALGASTLRVDIVRVCGAALGPLLLFACFELRARAVQKKG